MSHRSIPAAAAAFLLLASSVRADVIPVTYEDASADRAGVAASLRSAGVPSPEARALASALPESEAAWFAADPDRVRRAGAQDVIVVESRPSRVEALIFGGLFLGASLAVAGVAWYHYEHDHHHKH